MSVGLDIGSVTIKAVEIKSEGGRPVLKSAGIIGVKDLSIDRIQSNSEYVTVADTIKRLFAASKISSKQVNISLPESLVFTRSIKFPILTDQEIASAVKWQAEEIIPIPIKEAIFQHVVLERKENAQPPFVSVLVVAAPRALVEKYIKLLGMAGLTVVGVETELLALTRALSVPGQTIVILDLGAKSTNLGIIKNEKLVFTRTIPTAGDAFTRAVAQNFGVNTSQADEYKKTYGLSPSQLEGKVANAISPVFRIITENISKAVHFYQTDEGEEQPSLIEISGGTAGLPEINTTLTKLIGSEVVIANPFSKLVVDENTKQSLNPYAPLYSVAVGLALKEG
ncbi:MAG TPA: type IV pilus assembly protein PilM [Patescibacteria group bacterium]|nr:type IV pilus assembly protein PilM [Patescibacteria group bacterium]